MISAFKIKHNYVTCIIILFVLIEFIIGLMAPVVQKKCNSADSHTGFYHAKFTLKIFLRAILKPHYLTSPWVQVNISKEVLLQEKMNSFIIN
jgi:hypothetical protein